MRIRTQLYLGAALSCLLVTAVGATLYITARQVTQAIRETGAAIEVSEALSQRRFVMLEYIVYGTERPKMQFLQRHESLDRLLAADPYDGRAEHELWTSLRGKNREAHEIFVGLVSNRADKADASDEAELAADVEAQLISQLFQVSQQMVADISALQRASGQRLAESERRGSALVVVFTVLIAALVIGSALHVQGVISAPLSRLHEAIARIRTGDLDVTTGVKARNEIGDLARSFDTMAADLRHAHAAQREAEREREERNTQLKAANKELEAFAYSVSHDLRAPLRSIDGFSQALLEDYEAKLDAEGKDSLRRVRDASQRMGQLIDDMLQLSRVTRGELDLGPVDLSALAEASVAELRRSAPERHVTVAIEPGVTGRGDGRLLGAVMENLFSNAWKFTSKKDPATIEFGAERKEGELVCHVHDDGAGFDMAFADGLFAPFQRLHKASEFPGNGIGLATVKRIIARLGGRVWADAAVGQGATFYFSLPEASPKGA